MDLFFQYNHDGKPIEIHGIVIKEKDGKYFVRGYLPFRSLEDAIDNPIGKTLETDMGMIKITNHWHYRERGLHKEYVEFDIIHPSEKFLEEFQKDR